MLRAVATSLVVLALLPTPAGAQDDIPEVVKSLIEEGGRHRQAGRIGQAAESYREARRLAPTVVEPYVALGELLNEGGDREGAYESFRAGLGHDPQNAVLLFNAAVLGLRLERFEEALGYVESALGSDRKNANLHALHGAVLRGLGRLEEALVALEEAVRLESGNPRLLFGLGNLYHDLERRDEAVAAYQKAIRKDEGYLRAYYNLGAVLFEMSNFVEAEAAYEVALRPVEAAFASGQPVDAVHARAFLNLGAIRFQKQEWNGALDAYGKALRLDPKLSQALYSQGFIHFQQGRDDAARETYLRALEIDPELPLAYLHLGQIYQRRGEAAAAASWLEKGMARFDEGLLGPAHLTLARARHALGQTGSAVESYREAVTANPENAPALAELGRLLRRQGDTDGARELLERARTLLADDDSIALELALVARADGDLGRERSLYEEILERSPTAQMWPVRLNLGLLVLRQGDRRAARSHLEPIVERLPSLVGEGLAAREAHLVAAVCALVQAADGDFDAARAALDQVARDDPDLASAAGAAAVLTARAGDSEAAAEVLARAFDGAEGELASLLGASLGKVLYAAGRDAEARGPLAAAAEAFPRDAAVRAALGEAALRARDFAGAAASLAQARELCGPSGEIASAEGGRLRVHLPPADAGALCGHIEKNLALAHLGSSLEALAGGSASSARRSATAALGLPLGETESAVALFVRGTAQLLGGAPQGARADLSAGLAKLPASFGAQAHNNLGVAYLRLGQVDAARRELEAARAAGGDEATLNLAILLDDHTDEARQALDLYEEYLRSGGRRRQDVEVWAQRLRKVYR